MQEKGDIYLIPAQQSNLLQSDDLCKWIFDPEYPILPNTG